MVKEEVQMLRLGSKEPLVVGSKVFVSSNVYDLTEKEIEKARNELGETEEKRKKYLEELKSALTRKGKYRTDESFLLRFLRVRKFDYSKTYDNVKNFYSMRGKHFDFFGSPCNLQSHKSVEFVTILPYTDEDGSILFWIDTDYWTSQNLSFENLFQPVAAAYDIAITNPKCQVNGILGIWNLGGVGFRECSEFLKKNRPMALASLAQYSYPWRIKKVVMFNANWLCRTAYNVIRPLLSKKLTERIYVLGSDLKELHQHVDPAVLPRKHGGSLDDDFCRRPQLILDNIPYLEYDRSFTGEFVAS